MVEETSAGPAMQECGICSNGPHKVYHIGAPCPYAYPRPEPQAKPFNAGNLERCVFCGLHRGDVEGLRRQLAKANAMLDEAAHFAANQCIHQDRMHDEQGHPFCPMEDEHDFERYLGRMRLELAEINEKLEKAERERDEARKFALSVAQELANVIGEQYGFSITATEGAKDG